MSAFTPLPPVKSVPPVQVHLHSQWEAGVLLLIGMVVAFLGSNAAFLWGHTLTSAAVPLPAGMVNTLAEWVLSLTAFTGGALLGIPAVLVFVLVYGLIYALVGWIDAQITTRAAELQPEPALAFGGAVLLVLGLFFVGGFVLL